MDGHSGVIGKNLFGWRRMFYCGRNYMERSFSRQLISFAIIVVNLA